MITLLVLAHIFSFWYVFLYELKHDLYTFPRLCAELIVLATVLADTILIIMAFYKYLP